MPEAVSHITADPQGSQFGRSAVLAGDGEAGQFKLSSHIVAQGAAGAIRIRTDQEDQGDGFAIDLPFAIHQFGAILFHGGGDISNGLVGIVGHLGLQATDDIHMSCVIREGGHERYVFGHSQAAIHFLVDVIAIDQVVEGFADADIRHGVELTAGEGRRVEGQFVVQTVLE